MKLWLKSLALAALSTVGIALHQSGSGPDPLKLDVHFSPFHLLDLGEKGPSLGDQTLFDDELFRDGQPVGYDEGFCVITRVRAGGPHPLLDECTVSFVLQGGQISGQGSASDAPRKELAITGGTGLYADVRGQITLEEFGNGQGALTLEFRR